MYNDYKSCIREQGLKLLSEIESEEKFFSLKKLFKIIELEALTRM